MNFNDKINPQMKHYITILLFGLSTTFAMSQTLLKYDLKEGDSFLVQQKAEQIITQELNGAEHVLTNALEGLLEFKVLGTLDDNYLVSLVFKDLNMEMTSSMQGELMKVRAKEVVEGDIQSKIFNSLLDNPVELTLDPTGNILKVVGGDSLITKMTNASGLEDDFSKNMMKKSLEKEFGSEALSNNYKQMTYIYGKDMVRGGDSWENSFEGKVEAQNTWTLSTLSDIEANINGTAEVKLITNDQSVSMELNGEQTTSIVASLSDGFIKTMLVEGLFKGMSVMPQLGTTEIPTTIKSTTTYELIQ
jgi:hypothetical protein